MYYFLVCVPIIFPMVVVLGLFLLSPWSYIGLDLGLSMQKNWYDLVAITGLLVVALYAWGRPRSIDAAGVVHISQRETWFLRCVGLWLVIDSFVIYRFGWDAFLPEEWWRALATAALQATLWAGVDSLFKQHEPYGMSPALTCQELAEQPAGDDQIQRAKAYCSGNSVLLARVASVMESGPNRGRMVELLEELRIKVNTESMNSSPVKEPI